MTIFQRLMTLARHRNAEMALAMVSFADSSFLPLPPHALLIPLVLAQPERALRLGLVCTLASVLGGYVGYAIGHVLYDTLGLWIIETYRYQEAFARFQDLFRQWGAWIIIGKGLTPIPFKIVTIAAGVASYDLLEFTWASIISRGGQFVAIALLVRRFGPVVEPILDRYMWQATGVGLALVIGGFWVLNYL